MQDSLDLRRVARSRAYRGTANVSEGSDNSPTSCPSIAWRAAAKMLAMDFVDGTLGDGTIVSFAPDARFAAVRYSCHNDAGLVVELDLPFAGWALVLRRNASDPTFSYTDLEPLGLDNTGKPITRAEIAANFSLDETRIVQTSLTTVDGREAAGTATPGWDAIRPSR
jgi:hypothetical protein